MAAPILSISDLNTFRGLVTDLALPETCTIVRVSEVRDAGGVSTIETVLATGVPCRYSEVPDSTLRALGERLDPATSAKLVMPAHTDILKSDRITDLLIGGATIVEYRTPNRVERLQVGGVNFGAFEVTDVQRKSWEMSRIVYLKQVT